VLWVLKHLIAKHGTAKRIKVDNGRGRLVRSLLPMARELSMVNEIEFKHIEPAKLTPNAVVAAVELSGSIKPN
jgi:hypothetical protein